MHKVRDGSVVAPATVYCSASEVLDKHSMNFVDGLTALHESSLSKRYVVAASC